MYTAKDDFSENMLKSVPKKVVNWLALLQIDLVEPFQYGTLHVEGDLDRGTIRTASTELQWFGNPNDPDAVHISDFALTDISKNLDAFIAFEKLIYDQLQLLQMEILDKTAAKMPVIPRTTDEQSS